MSDNSSKAFGSTRLRRSGKNNEEAGLFRTWVTGEGFIFDIGDLEADIKGSESHAPKQAGTRVDGRQPSWRPLKLGTHGGPSSSGLDDFDTRQGL